MSTKRLVQELLATALFNNPNLKTTQTDINRRMDKSAVAYPYRMPHSTSQYITEGGSSSPLHTATEAAQHYGTRCDSNFIKFKKRQRWPMLTEVMLSSRPCGSECRDWEEAWGGLWVQVMLFPELGVFSVKMHQAAHLYCGYFGFCKKFT